MTEETPYQRLRREREARRLEEIAKDPQPYYPPEVRKARNAEKNRRNAESRRRAHLILAQRHASEYAKLLEVEAAGLDEERGPLPGDPDYPNIDLG